jgi:uncharacterized small protein (DUF1192 family)
MLDHVKKAMSVVNRSANRLRKQIAEIGEQISALEKEKSALCRTPVLQNDFVRAICGAIDVMAEEEREAYSTYLWRQVMGRMRGNWGHPIYENMVRMMNGRVKLHGLFTRQENYPDPDTLPLLPAMFLFRDAIKKALTESIEAFEWPISETKSFDEIRARIAEIDDEMERLEAKRKELYAVAEEVGIDVSDDRLFTAQQPASEEPSEEKPAEG